MGCRPDYMNNVGKATRIKGDYFVFYVSHTLPCVMVMAVRV